MAKITFFATCLLASVTGLQTWQQWHSRALKKAQANAGLSRLLHSLDLHSDAQSLLNRTDQKKMTSFVQRQAREILQKHANAIDRLIERHAQTSNINGEVAALKKAEGFMGQLYRQLVTSSKLLPGVHPTSASELGAALQGATGIDLTDKDAKLFHIMTENFGGDPPPAALGVSAKFHPKGVVEAARYHVALKLPCEGFDDGNQLLVSARAAARVLQAPQLVHAWVEKLSDAAVASAGFGFVRLKGGARAGKIYITNHAGKFLPSLPLGGKVTVGNAIPSIRDSANSQMVSLEWRFGDQHLVLRHYAMEYNVSHEERLYSSTINTAVADGLVTMMKTAGSATESVSITAPFLEADVENNVLSPKLSKGKVGLQLPDAFMSDERFLWAAKPVLGAVGVDTAAVMEWLESSWQLGHAVSNVQAGNGFITLYRHPLELCARTSLSPLRRLDENEKYKTDCDKAKDAYLGNVWTGACKKDMGPSEECEKCIEDAKERSGDDDLNFPSICADICEKDWKQPCTSNCKAAQEELREKCSGCKLTQKQWCGEKIFHDGKEGDDIPIDYMLEHHPDKVYDPIFSDGSFTQMIEMLGPQNCRYPIHPWWDKSKVVCDRCDSVYDGLHNMMLWGGPCVYTKACEDERVDKFEKPACLEKLQCGCHCKSIINWLDDTCNAGDDLCQPNQPAACKTEQDFHNKCDYKTFKSDWKDNHLWSGKIQESQCYDRKTKSMSDECTADSDMNSAQIQEWYKKGLIKEFVESKNSGKEEKYDSSMPMVGDSNKCSGYDCTGAWKKCDEDSPEKCYSWCDSEYGCSLIEDGSLCTCVHRCMKSTDCPEEDVCVDQSRWVEENDIPWVASQYCSAGKTGPTTTTAAVTTSLVDAGEGIAKVGDVSTADMAQCSGVWSRLLLFVASILSISL